MPFQTIAQLPDGVKSAYSERCQSVFLRTFNAAMDPDKGGGAADEEAAFKVAHTAAKMCEGSGKADSADAVPTPLKAAALDPGLMDAWWAGKVARPMLAIPFSGPIPSPDGKSRDFDLEYFDQDTDVKVDWFTERPVLWHHGNDPSGFMGARVLGKALDPVMEEDGWWVDLWLNAGERRLTTIRKLAEKAEQAGSAVQLYGSSAAIPHLIRRNRKSGHIDVWPWWEQTLSTSPQNTHSVFPRAAKAVLADFETAEITVPVALKAVLTELDALRTPLTASSSDADGHERGGSPAKAGRELSGANLAELEEWAALFDALTPQLSDVATRARSLIERVRARYTPKESSE